MNYLQQIKIVRDTKIDDLNNALQSIIKTNSRIDFIIPNHHEGGWLIVYTPNTLII